MAQPCNICGGAGDFDPCPDCRDDEERAIQAAAIRAGAQAYREGRPVIFIHGRPYADPAGEPPEQPPEATDHEPESPFPWDLWDDGRP